MQKTLNRLLSFLLSVMMLVTMLPVSAFAAEPENDQQLLDSGTPVEDGPQHWLQEYQEYVLSQMNASSGPRKARAAGGATASYRIISWAGGTENRLTFANGAYLGDGMPRITLNGEVAFAVSGMVFPPPAAIPRPAKAATQLSNKFLPIITTPARATPITPLLRLQFGRT